MFRARSFSTLRKRPNKGHKVFRQFSLHSSDRAFCAGRIGGFLFEHFVETMGKPSSHEEWESLKDKADHAPFSPTEQNAILARIKKREKNKYHGWLLFALANISSDCNQQLFFTTSAARYHGLSRSGIHQQAQLGFMMKQTQFDDQSQVALKKAHETVRSN